MSIVSIVHGCHFANIKQILTLFEKKLFACQLANWKSIGITIGLPRFIPSIQDFHRGYVAGSERQA